MYSVYELKLASDIRVYHVSYFLLVQILSENKEYYVYVPKESAVNFEITMHSDRVNVTCRRNSDTQFISHLTQVRAEL
jgi:hypothetical protein